MSGRAEPVHSYPRAGESLHGGRKDGAAHPRDNRQAGRAVRFRGSAPLKLFRRLARRWPVVPVDLAPALALEWHLVPIRWVGIAAVAPALLLAPLDGAHRALAYGVLVVAAAYNMLVVALSRRRPALLTSGYLTSFCDSLLNVMMIAAVGGFDSPFYYVLFTVTISSAMRFGYGPAVASVCMYVGLDGLAGLHAGHVEWAAYLCRSGFLAITALLAGYLSAQTRRAQASAEELVHLQDDFVASVGHELRTPLTIIVGYAELLLARWQQLDDAHRSDHLRRIVFAAARQQRLVQDLLLLSNLESDVKLITRPAHIALGALLGQACDDLRSSYRRQEIELVGEADVSLLADPDRTLQILANLLDNAAKYSPDGCPIVVTSTCESGMGVVRVRDFGSGIPDDGRSRLFTRFGRVLGSRMREGRVGTGLGLYLSRQLAEAMNGSLELESTGPDGSVFKLSLPSCQPLPA